MRFAIDEDMPRSLGHVRSNAGHEALDVRDHGLRGAGATANRKTETSRDAVLITEDLGFANLLRFPLGSHSGIIVVRFPGSVSTAALVSAITQAIEIIDVHLPGNLVIVEPGRIRMRSAATGP